MIACVDKTEYTSALRSKHYPMLQNKHLSCVCLFSAVLFFHSPAFLLAVYYYFFVVVCLFVCLGWLFVWPCLIVEYCRIRSSCSACHTENFLFTFTFIAFIFILCLAFSLSLSHS